MHLCFYLIECVVNAFFFGVKITFFFSDLYYCAT